MLELEIGVCTGEIKSHSLRVIGDKDAVSVQVETEYGAQTQVLIFLTDKSMGIARTQLKACGFDVDKYDIDALDDDQTMLAGNKIPLIIEEYNGKIRAGINLNRSVDKDKRPSITKKLRDAKKTQVAPAEDDIPF